MLMVSDEDSLAQGPPHHYHSYLTHVVLEQLGFKHGPARSGTTSNDGERDLSQPLTYRIRPEATVDRKEVRLVCK